MGMVTTAAPPPAARARRPLLLGLRLRGAWAWWRYGCPTGYLMMRGEWAAIGLLCDLLDKLERGAA